jgi:hypothetical protein
MSAKTPNAGDNLLFSDFKNYWTSHKDERIYL